MRSRLVEFVEKGHFQFYPDVECNHLRKELEKYTGVEKESILVFSGSDSALEYIARTFIESGDEVVIAGPTYDNMRVYVESCGANIVRSIHEQNPLEHSPETLKKSLTKETKIAYLVSPNNPTGHIWEESIVKELLNLYPETLFILDEAYFEFSGKTCSELVREYKNIIVCRTFSKAFGLAGLRCGYIMAHPTILAPIQKIRVGKNVNSIAQVAALAALEDIQTMKNYVKATIEGQDWLCKELNKLGYWTFNTNANFILVKVKDPAETCSRLATHNIFVRNRDQIKELANIVRISTGPKIYMKKFLKVWPTVAEVI